MFTLHRRLPIRRTATLRSARSGIRADTSSSQEAQDTKKTTSPDPVPSEHSPFPLTRRPAVLSPDRKPRSRARNLSPKKRRFQDLRPQVQPPLPGEIGQGIPTGSSSTKVILYTRTISAIVEHYADSGQVARGYTCYEDIGQQDAPSEPPTIASMAPALGDVYMHAPNKASAAHQLTFWVYEGAQWMPIRIGDPHPTTSGYVLSVTRHGSEAAWLPTYTQAQTTHPILLRE